MRLMLASPFDWDTIPSDAVPLGLPMSEKKVFIYHIAPRQAWERACQVGFYHGDTLATEGFIHCSTYKQVTHTADRYYQGRSDLVLLCIDPSLVEAEIRYEASVEGDKFPHVYGPLATTAVRQTAVLNPNQDGSFSMPSVFDRP
jgi:uncharacterized protein (DUF952 family)